MQRDSETERFGNIYFLLRRKQLFLIISSIAKFLYIVFSPRLKIMSKFIYLVFTSIWCFNCTPSNTSQAPDNTIIQSTSNDKNLQLVESMVQYSVSGQSGARSTDYFFKMVVKSKETISFDSVWIGENRYAAFLSKQSSTITNEKVKMAQGDTIILRVSFLNATQSETKVKAPVAYEGKALIRYAASGKTNFLVVKELVLFSPPKMQ